MAHIDAGKTTFTERLLFITGKQHNIGEVHDGNTTMDWMVQEQERGITITSAATSTSWKTDLFTDVRFNVIDTPGHIDFTAEVEKSLRILDGAVIILDASAGVESQTETIWRQANKHSIPRIIFCNKMDKTGSDYFISSNSLINKLSIKPLLLQIPIGTQSEFHGIIDVVNMKAVYWNQNGKDLTYSIMNIPNEYKNVANEQRRLLVDSILEFDHNKITTCLRCNKLDSHSIISLIRLATISGKAFPIMCGSAFKNKAIQPVLDAIVNYLPSPDDRQPVRDSLLTNKLILRFPSNSEPTSMLIFKIMSDIYSGFLCFVRIYSGSVKQGEVVYNIRNNSEQKITKLLKMHANFRTELSHANSGDIISICGIKNSITGDTLCDITSPISLFAIKFPTPVICVALEPDTEHDQEKLINILYKYSLEDPTLSFKINEESGQIMLSGMGELHLDIIIDRILREHNLMLKPNKPQVAYREMLLDKCIEEYTHRKQTGGAGQFAKVKMLFEPTHNDEFEFRSEITGGSIPKEYIPGIKKGLESAIINGPALGYPIIRLKVTLIDGEHHDVDSSILAFEIAAKQCLKQAIQRMGVCILEPIMKVEIFIPDIYIGDVTSDLKARGGHITDQTSINKTGLIKAKISLANTFKYIDTLRSLTKGTGTYFIEFDSYAKLNK